MLFVVQNGVLACEIDVLDYVRVYLLGEGPFWVKEPDSFEWYMNRVRENEVTIGEDCCFEIDWDGLVRALPTLEPPLLSAGEECIVRGLSAGPIAHGPGIEAPSDFNPPPPGYSGTPWRRRPAPGAAPPRAPASSPKA